MLTEFSGHLEVLHRYDASERLHFDMYLIGLYEMLSSVGLTSFQHSSRSRLYQACKIYEQYQNLKLCHTLASEFSAILRNPKLLTQFEDERIPEESTGIGLHESTMKFMNQLVVRSNEVRDSLTQFGRLEEILGSGVCAHMPEHSEHDSTTRHTIKFWPRLRAT